MLQAFAVAARRSRRTAAAVQRIASVGSAMTAKKTMVLQPAPGAPPG